MGKKGLVVLLAGCISIAAIFPSLSYAIVEKGPRGGDDAEFNVTPGMAANWANEIDAFFSSRDVDPSILSDVFPRLDKLDLGDPGVRASVAPVTQQIQAVADRLLPVGAWYMKKKAQHGWGAEGSSGSEQVSLPSPIKKLVILSTFFREHLTKRQELQIQREIIKPVPQEKFAKLVAEIKGISEIWRKPSDDSIWEAGEVGALVDASRPLQSRGQEGLSKEPHLQPFSHGTGRGHIFSPQIPVFSKEELYQVGSAEIFKAKLASIWHNKGYPVEGEYATLGNVLAGAGLFSGLVIAAAGAFSYVSLLIGVVWAIAWTLAGAVVFVDGVRLPPSDSPGKK